MTEIPEGYRPVIVTTEHRFVAFGYADETSGDVITLISARCAIRFGTTGGLLQLAGTGPTSQSKIGARAPKIELRKVTSVLEVSDEARDAWERA